MKKFEVYIISKEYRRIEVEADDSSEAYEKAWDQIENAMNCKPEDYDTDVYVEGEVQDAASYT